MTAMKLPRLLLAMSLFSLLLGSARADALKVGAAAPVVAGMTDAETEQTADLLRQITAQNRSVVVVEHDMEFVARIAHKVTVLHQGKILAAGNMAAVQNDPKVIEVYLGH